MKKARSYHILEEDSLEHLEFAVRDTFQNGYVPVGGICVCPTAQGLTYLQAIVLYENEKPG